MCFPSCQAEATFRQECRLELVGSMGIFDDYMFVGCQIRLP
jgi:hypothetical protein